MRNLLKDVVVAALLLGPLGVLPAGAQLVPLGPETVVVSGTSLGVQCPQVIGHADRSFTVVWPQLPVESDPSLVAQRFNGTGSPVGGPIDVDAGTLAGRVPFDIAVENRGALGDIVTWSSVPEGASNPSRASTAGCSRRARRRGSARRPT